MQHALDLNLTTPANQVAPPDSVLRRPITNPANDGFSPLPAANDDSLSICTDELHRQQCQEDFAISLRKEGVSYDNIKKKTGLPERKIKDICKDVTKGKAVTTPFDKTVSRVLPLAIRPQGIKEYELRTIAFEEYAPAWNSEKGEYELSHDKQNLTRIRSKVREFATTNGDTAIFVTDWVNNSNPTGSRLALERAAIELECRIVELVDAFMSEHCTDYSPNQIESTEAQRKQQFSARRHILKLAIKEYDPEPTDVLLERTLTMTDSLDGISDAAMKSQPKVKNGKKGPFPEPHGANHFLDYVEACGWLN